MAEQTCKERIGEHLEGRLADLRRMMKAERMGDEDKAVAYLDKHGLGPLNEYGLGLSYVPEPGSGGPYFCFLLSTGGPHDEFRFYASPDGWHSWKLDRVVYCFKDWFDGAQKQTRAQVLFDLFDWFNECEVWHYKAAGHLA